MINLEQGQRLLNLARHHFEASTGLQTNSVKLKIHDEYWWEAHIEGNSLSDDKIVATHKSYPEHGYSIIILREEKMTTVTETMLDILHELTHQHVQPHNNKFYNILKKTGVRIGASTGHKDYRYESASLTIKQLLKGFI